MFSKQKILEHQRIFLAATLDKMNVGVVACNEKGELILFNQTACDWHGLDPRHIPQEQWAHHYGLFMDDGLTPMDINTVPLARAYRGQEVQNISMVIAAKGQPQRHILAYASPIKREDGHILGAIAVMYDITDRKRAEQALKLNEERFRRLMESTIDYIYTVRFENGQAVETIHGHGCEAVTGHSCEEYKADPHLWYKMIYRDDRDKVVDMSQRVLQGLRVEPLEHRIYHPDGTIRWLQNTLVIKKDVSGQLISYDGLVVDITAKKQVEEALKESEARFSTVFQLSPIGIALVRKFDNKFLDVNSVFLNIVGFTREDLLGHTANELGIWVYPQDREKLISELNKHGKVEQFEYKIRSKSGAVKDLILSVGVIVIAKQEYLLFVTMDMTDKKFAQQKLKQESDQWQITFDAMLDLIFIQDKDMNILKVNKACAQALKMEPKDITGKKCYGTMHHLNHPWMGCPFEKTKQDHEIHTEEVRDPRLGISLLVTVSPIFNSLGEFVGAVHVARNITELKRVEAEKNQHLRELEIFYKGSIGREERILDLKEEIVRLKGQLNSIKKSDGNTPLP